MNIDLKQRWVDALRSGEYAQTQEVLRNDKGFCCLGVLADIVDHNAWYSRRGDEDYDYEEAYWEWTDLDCKFDTARIRELGLLRSDDDDDSWHRLQDELITANDEGKPFSEIADMIQKHVKEDV